MLILMKIGLWLKKYFWIPLTFIVAILFYLLKGSSSAKKVLDITRDSVNKQKETIDKIEKEKQEQKEQVKKLHEEMIKKIDEDFILSKKEVKEETQKQVKEITKKYKNDPDKLGQIFAEEFGLVLERKEND